MKNRITIGILLVIVVPGFTTILLGVPIICRLGKIEARIGGKFYHYEH